MDEQRQRVRALFDTVADSYDQVGVDFFGPIAQGLVDLLDPQPAERALDIGCGRGAALLPIARLVGPNGWALGGDLSPNMVSEARRLASAAGLDHVDVLELDAQAPELPDHLGTPDFDLVAASLVLFFLPDPLEALRRWLACLRPGGRLGISTFGAMDPAWARVEEVFRPYLPPEMLDARTSGQTGPFASDAGVEGLLADAGFVEVRTSHHPVAAHFTDAEQWYDFSMSVGQRAFWAAIPEDERPTVKTEAQRRLNESAAADGSLSFTQDVRYTLGLRPE